VKRLSIDITKIPDQLMLQLPTIFPNITEFRTHIWNDRMRSRGSYFTDTVLQWSNTLEIYDIRCDWIEILPVLKTTVFPRLTALFLGYSYNREDKNEGFDIAYFIPHIKNAPALRELTLDSCALLRSLKLYSTSIVIKQDKLFQPIIPTSSLVYLEIEQPFCFDTNGLLLDYITSKYRCLKELALSFELEYNTFPFDGYYSKVDISPFTDRDSESDEDDIHEPKIQGKGKRTREDRYYIYCKILMI
jgi:hypothetical protein